MAMVTFTEVTDRFVLYFDTKQPRIRAETLTEILAGLRQALNAASTSLGGEEIPLYLGRVEEGSLKALLIAGAITATSGIAINMISSALYDLVKTDKPWPGENGMCIPQGTPFVAVPVESYERWKRLENAAFNEGIARVLTAVVIDKEITGFVVLPPHESTPPPFTISGYKIQSALTTLRLRQPSKITESVQREKVESVLRASVLSPTAQMVPDESVETRELSEERTIQITRKPSAGKAWHLVLDGFAIKATLKDGALGALQESDIKRGDAALVTLKITQTKDAASEIYSNTSFVIEKILDHKPKTLPRIAGPK